MKSATRSHLTRLAAASAALAISSCAPAGDGGGAGPERIQYVRSDPPTAGYQRLATRASTYPDLAFFVSKQGPPDFLVETGNDRRRYLILYYLAGRQAFACRTRRDDARAVEFSGPYPITDREFRLLERFRKSARTESGDQR